ncbi:MAG: DUF4440 domain-containing protein [Candidatus Delongbacteria bacterium]|nr:DUF4440 domain-containing protein [Candidatus Delongbacteria bacterium]
MKKYNLLVVLMVVVALAAGCGCAKSQPEQAPIDPTQIDQIRIDFNTAFNAHNADGIAQLMDPAGAMLSPNQAENAMTIESIRTMYADLFSKVHAAFELKPSDIQASCDLAAISGDFTRVDTSLVDGSIKSTAGHYVFILKKQADGSWKIFRDIWNEAVIEAEKP